MEQLLFNNYIINISNNEKLIFGIYNKITFLYYENIILNKNMTYDIIKNNIIKGNIQIINNNDEMQITINNNTITLNIKTPMCNNKTFENLQMKLNKLFETLFINYVNNIKPYKTTIHYDERYYISMTSYDIFNDVYCEKTYLSIKNNIFNINKSENTEKYINKLNYFFNETHNIILNIINYYKINNNINIVLFKNNINNMENTLFNNKKNKLFMDEYNNIFNNFILNIRKL
jgi:hypothetical protein